VDLSDVIQTSATDGRDSNSPIQIFNAAERQPAPAPEPVVAVGQSGLPLVFAHGRPTEVADSPRRRAYFRAKRGLDIVLASGALLLLSPALLIITLAIMAGSPGGALFRQPRVGFRGRQFTILKFRTMYADRSDIGGSRQASADDDRVTPIGRKLRKGNLDELPQLINIIRGDMSLVGPRPYPLDMTIEGTRYEDHVPYYDMRFSVPPGLSGWAQANGLRGATEDAASARVRVDHDIAYVQNASLWLDLRILWRTARREFLGGGTGF
jgi:lipopolysaccharide/colanic/teichoic acid biosynthesis glycosyltransferase